MIGRLRNLWRAIQTVDWMCALCFTVNHTPLLFWHTVKYSLICQHCRMMQNYPVHIRGIDPEPPRQSEAA
jgi:hypothetical protein